jgi:predicted lipoprotein with Yx(FWY)xxD motif
MGMKSKKTYTALTAFAVLLILVVTACGGSGDNGAEESASSGSDAATTVSVGSADGVGDVLVDEEGSALYGSVQEADGMVRCTDACAAIWVPLTVDGEPTGSDGLGTELGVVTRPEGTQQVTFNNRPLYTFIEDTGPDTVTGNGFSDTFGDLGLFEWHVATPTGISISDANTSESADNGFYGP